MIGDDQAAWRHIDRRGVDADGQQFERTARPALFDSQALRLVDPGVDCCRDQTAPDEMQTKAQAAPAAHPVRRGR